MRLLLGRREEDGLKCVSLPAWPAKGRPPSCDEPTSLLLIGSNIPTQPLSRSSLYVAGLACRSFVESMCRTPGVSGLWGATTADGRPTRRPVQPSETEPRSARPQQNVGPKRGDTPDGQQRVANAQGWHTVAWQASALAGGTVDGVGVGPHPTCRSVAGSGAVWCSDPFAGSGTTLQVATSCGNDTNRHRLTRRFVSRPGASAADRRDLGGRGFASIEVWWDCDAGGFVSRKGHQPMLTNEKSRRSATWGCGLGRSVDCGPDRDGTLPPLLLTARKHSIARGFWPVSLTCRSAYETRNHQHPDDDLRIPDALDKD